MKYILITLLSLPCIFMYSQTSNSWTRVADFEGGLREGAVFFSIDSFGYIGLGTYQDTFPFPPIFATDFWQYNPYTNVWKQKANFPGAGRIGGAFFSIGSKGYVGLGANDYSQGLNDFWEYDPATDTWTQKADFGGDGRSSPVGFSIGNFGYAGLGISDTTGQHKDLWQYNPSIDSWTQKADFGGEARSEAIGFSIDSMGYVGLGTGPNSVAHYNNDLWQYNPARNAWLQMANFPGEARLASFSFSIGAKGYVGTGMDTVALTTISQFWEYNSLTNAWIQKDSFGGGVRGVAAGFSIGNKGYAGTGEVMMNDSTGPVTYYKDFWMYTPDSIVTGIKQIQSTSSLSLYPNPNKGSFTLQTSNKNGGDYIISDMLGNIVAQHAITSDSQEISLPEIEEGVYTLVVKGSPPVRFVVVR